MVIKQLVDEALHTPMSRKDFLKHTGTLLMVVVGFSAVVHSLDRISENHSGKQNHSGGPPDSASYGG